MSTALCIFFEQIHKTYSVTVRDFSNCFPVNPRPCVNHGWQPCLSSANRLAFWSHRREVLRIFEILLVERSQIFNFFNLIEGFYFRNVKFVSELGWILWLNLLSVHVRSWINIYFTSRLNPLFMVIRLHQIDIAFVPESFQKVLCPVNTKEVNNWNI